MCIMMYYIYGEGREHHTAARVSCHPRVSATFRIPIPVYTMHILCTCMYMYAHACAYTHTYMEYIYNSGAGKSMRSDGKNQARLGRDPCMHAYITYKYDNIAGKATRPGGEVLSSVYLHTY